MVRFPVSKSISLLALSSAMGVCAIGVGLPAMARPVTAAAALPDIAARYALSDKFNGQSLGDLIDNADAAPHFVDGPKGLLYRTGNRLAQS